MTPQTDKKLFLLDGMALVYRAFFALSKAPRINSKGLNTSAVLGFANALLDLLKKEHPTHIGVAFDTHAPTARHEAYADYKANREKMPEDLSRALPYVHRLLEVLRIPILEMPGYEADDLVGTLAKQAEREGFYVYMVTFDKDYGQLVSDRIFMYKPPHRGQGAEIYGVPEVCEHFGIKRPTQIIDLLGLGGDKADNIPGVPGFGAMTAQKLLQQFDSVEELIAHSNEIQPVRFGERLKEYAEQALFSKKLATIMLDAPITLDEASLRLKLPDQAATEALLDELELRSFSARLLDFYGLRPSAGMGYQMPETAAEPAAPAATAPTATAPATPVATVAEEATPVAPKRAGRSPKPTVLEGPDLFSMLTEDGAAGTATATAEPAPCGTDVRLWPDFDTLQREFNTLFGSAEPLAVAVACDNEERWRYAAMTQWFFAHPQQGVFRYDPPQPLGEREKHWFEDNILGRETPWAVYHVKRLWHLCRHAGMAVERLEARAACKDVMLAHYVADPENGHTFARIVESVLHERCIPDPTPTGQCLQEAARLWPVWESLRTRLAETDSIALLETMEMPLAYVLAQMEADGVKVDPALLKAFQQTLDAKMQTLSQEIYTLAGQSFNIGSPKQLGEILYEKLQITDKPKHTKTKQWSTAEDILQKLASKHPIVNLVLSYRSLSKLKSSYAEALPQLIDAQTGRIHTTFNQAVAATGRLSSTNPNLQSIPVRNDMGREIRKAFVPYGTDDLLLSADYSQIELRIIASVSGDTSMQADFSAHKDVHTATAAKVFNVSLEDVTPAQRRMAKTVNFGIIYGISAFGLAERLQIGRREAAELIEKYFVQYPKLKTYMEGVLAEARDKGYVETLCRRRRYLPDIVSGNAVVRGYAERNAVNAPIQGTSADMIKLAMIRIAKRLKTEGFAAKMLLQVHDELIFNVPRTELAALQALVETEMKQALPLEVPIEVEMQAAANWSDAH
ncbi:MAG: DNA polymerase I [Bacteroidales bacterium]|nr:DNA polymerase I [Bacteroidales bacterium]